MDLQKSFNTHKYYPRDRIFGRVHTGITLSVKRKKVKSRYTVILITGYCEKLNRSSHRKNKSKAYSIKYNNVFLEPKLWKKEVEEVATKAKEVEQNEVKVELPEDTVTLDLLIHTRDCVVLQESIFGYVQKASVDQIRSAWEKLVHHVVAIHGHDIGKNLPNKNTVIITKTEHTQYAWSRALQAH